MGKPRLIHRLLGAEALAARYERRRLDAPQTGNRTPATMAVAASILTMLIVYFLAAIHSKPAPRSYLETRSRLVTVEPSALNWEASPILRKVCDSGDPCREMILASTGRKLAPTTLIALGQAQVLREKGVVLVRFALDRARLDGLAEFLTLTLSIPGFQYFRGDLYINGVRQRTFYLSRGLTTVFEPSVLAAGAATVDLLLEVLPEQTALWDARADEPLIVATQHEFEAYTDFLATERAGKGRWIGVVSIVVLAIFALLLFLIIDGSPESLGLAFAMGFDACYLVLRHRWLAVDLLGNRLDLGLEGFFFEMGLVFKIYFCAQLARVSLKSIRPWLVGGSAVSVLYGAARYYGATRSVGGSDPLFLVNDLIFHGAALAVSLRGLVAVRTLRLPWRTLALAFATVAMALLAANEIYLLQPLKNEALKAFLTSAVPNTPYLLALSAFVNISTLENRVRSLSESAIKARTLESDLELGKAVQQDLHQIPKMPRDLAIAVHFDALAYVSGDTYFVDWYPDGGQLTVLLNDVTGHGIQAALKASACNSMAATVWTDAHDDGAFDRYFKMVQAYYNRHGEIADQAAITAVQLDTRAGVLRAYRGNYLHPLVIEPRRDTGSSDRWRVRRVTLPHREVVLTPLLPGSFVILLSDGFLANSSIDRAFLRGLRSELARAGDYVTPEGLKKAILGLSCFKDEEKNDDRTLLVVQWRPDQAA